MPRRYRTSTPVTLSGRVSRGAVGADRVEVVLWRDGVAPIVFAGAAYKLGKVDWAHDADDPLRDWTFRSRDGRLKLTLHPLAKEIGGLELGADSYSRFRKAYGRFSGTLAFAGRTVVVDGMLGFAEEQSLAW